jgi:regulator of sirC expression with transglutaminase-like and TPR domain
MIYVATIGRLSMLALSAALWAGLAPSPASAARGAEAPPPALPGLPVPPTPPRVAQGEDYERCLTMLGTDPTGADAFADAWEATGGGEGAMHCHALAEIAIGNPQTGADMLEKLANASRAPSLARASVYGQAVQAWLMADDPARAYAAATLALTLAPNDPGYLIDRSVAAATMERYLDAIADLNSALKIDPRRAEALVFRAAAWRHENRLDLAMADIERAVSIEPNNAEALLERGILRERTGNREGARADWESAIALAPGTATADLAQQNLGLLEAGPRAR